MSYDIHFKVKVEGLDNRYISVGDCAANTTWNLRDMIVNSTDLEWKNESNNGLCKDVIPQIIDGLKELTMYPNKYKKYEDWYPHEIRDEFGNDIANKILETVWYLSNFSCYNNEYDETFAAPTFQEVIDWMIEDRGIVISVGFLNESRKWVYRSQAMLGEYLKRTDAIECYTSSEKFDTWQEAMDFGIREMILNTNSESIIKGNWNKQK